MNTVKILHTYSYVISSYSTVILHTVYIRTPTFHIGTVYICYNVYTFLQSLHAGVKSIRVCLYHFRRNGHIIHVRFLPPVRGSLPNSLQICVSAKPTGRPWRSRTGWFLVSKINMSAKQFCTFWLGGVILYLLVYKSLDPPLKM